MYPPGVSAPTDPATLRATAAKLVSQAAMLDELAASVPSVMQQANALRAKAAELAQVADDTERVALRARQVLSESAPVARPLRKHRHMATANPITVNGFDRRTHARQMGRKNRRHTHPLWDWGDSKGLSLQQIADAIGVKRTTLSHWATGIRAIPRQAVERLRVLTGGVVTERDWARVQP